MAVSPTPQDWEAAGFRRSAVGWVGRAPGGVFDIREASCNGRARWRVDLNSSGDEDWISCSWRLFDTEDEAFQTCLWLAAVARQRDEDDA